MQYIDGLLKILQQIEMLQKVESSGALAKSDFKIKNLQKSSHDLYEIIHNQIFSWYTDVVYSDESDKPKFPAFKDISNNTFNHDHIQWLKSHACFAVYLKAKQNPLEANDLNYYLIIAELHGYKHICLVEFYRNKYKDVANAPDLRKFYTDAKKEMGRQFDFNSGKGKFLDLLMIMLVILVARENKEIMHEKIAKEFINKIEPACKIFKLKINHENTLSEFNELFATGVMHPITSLDGFYAHIESLKSSTVPQLGSISSSVPQPK